MRRRGSASVLSVLLHSGVWCRGRRPVDGPVSGNLDEGETRRGGRGEGPLDRPHPTFPSSTTSGSVWTGPIYFRKGAVGGKGQRENLREETPRRSSLGYFPTELPDDDGVSTTVLGGPRWWVGRPPDTGRSSSTSCVDVDSPLSGRGHGEIIRVNLPTRSVVPSIPTVLCPLGGYL